MQSILMHIEELVSLSEPIPCPIILPIDVYGTSVRLNRSVRVLHLDILVTHERPGGKVRPIELRSTPEVSNGLFVFCSQRVVVTYTCPRVTLTFILCEERGKIRTDETTDLGTVFVESKEVMCEPRQCQTILCNIQDVRVDVDVVNSAGVDFEDFFELLLCSGKI
jgi:hypothetical protein